LRTHHRFFTRLADARPKFQKSAQHATSQTKSPATLCGRAVGLDSYQADPNKIRKYIDFIDYYADLTEQEVIEYQQHYQTKEGDIMGMVQIWTEQGMQQGIQQGILQGEQIGEKKECVTLVTRQLRRKFGPQPDLETTLQNLPDMPLKNLEDLADALLDFGHIEDLQNWLKTKGL
jgi:hypothetical protein